MKTLCKFVVIVLFELITSFPCLSYDIPLPKGWRNPTNFETKDEWRSKDANKFLWIKADFNGDGIIDKASLLIRTTGNEVGLFAFVSQKDGLFKTFLLDKKDDINYIKVMGIAVVPPGRYVTACGKGAYNCVDVPPEITLANYAIDYFKFGSANMYFYWDQVKQKFKGVGIND